MAGRLEGKTALVTAAGQGIGRAIALAYAAEGATVTATDLYPEKLADLAAKGITVRALNVLDAMEIKEIAADLGRLDVLVNCAGYVHNGTILECDEEAWDFSNALNVRSMFRMIKAFLPAMIEGGGGSIVNIASVAGSLKGVPNRFVYGTTKAAVIGLTKSVACDFVKQSIRCNAICPGTVQTPSLDDRIAAMAAASGGGVDAARSAFVARQPLGRLGSPEEIAAAAVYLGGDESAFTTGTTMIIDGGLVL